MLILAKTVLGIMLGFIISIVTGLILIPILRKKHLDYQQATLGHNINTERESKSSPTIPYYVSESVQPG